MVFIQVGVFLKPCSSKEVSISIRTSQIAKVSADLFFFYIICTFTLLCLVNLVMVLCVKLSRISPLPSCQGIDTFCLYLVSIRCMIISNKPRGDILFFYDPLHKDGSTWGTRTMPWRFVCDVMSYDAKAS